MSAPPQESVSVTRSVSGATAVTVVLKHDKQTVAFTAKCFEKTVAAGYRDAKAGAESLLQQLQVAMS